MSYPCSDPCINVPYIEQQIEWSAKTFGPGNRDIGIMDHIIKEFAEIPDDGTEWIDVIILAIDGAWRRGMQPHEITQAVRDKLDKNMQRVWPDWRTAESGKAIEHDRSFD